MYVNITLQFNVVFNFFRVRSLICKPSGIRSRETWLSSLQGSHNRHPPGPIHEKCEMGEMGSDHGERLVIKDVC